MTATATPPDRDTPWTRLADFSRRHHWTALALWLVVVAAVTATSSVVGDSYDNDSSLPGTQSEELSDLLAEHDLDGAAETTTVVLHDEAGWDSDPAAVAALREDLTGQPHVSEVTGPDPARGQIAESGHTALMTVTYDRALGSIPTEDHRALLDAAQSHAGDDLQVELSGDAIRAVQESEAGGGAEGAGMLAALVILLFMFGSFLAATLPLITAVFAVGSTLGLVVLVSHLMTVPDYTAPVLMLVGLGVGIDYSLLIFSRYRSALLDGADRPGATRAALDTAGRAVLFAGVSVIIALLGLTVLGIPSLQGVVLGVTLTVAMTMLASLTLLPALLTVFGGRIERAVRKHAARRRRGRGDGWRRWAGRVQRRPWPAIVVAVAALAALASPALNMHLGLADAGNDHESTTTRAAYDLISDEFGPGRNGPLILAGEVTPDTAAAADRVLAGTPEVAETDGLRPVADGVRLGVVVPETGPQDPATTALVEELRAELPDDVLVGGATAANVDFAEAISDRFVPFLLVVVGLSALLLVVVFRSIPIALKAAVLNLLSIGAALGAMTVVFGEGLLGVPAGPIEAFLPVMIFAIVFGLSMDYEVFLLSRMHEEWCATGDAQRAVREGLAHTGGVITAAAAIMIVVFGAFMFSPERMLQQMGFGMAVAVLLDAVVIRCLLVPAIMRLLGPAAWWAPARWQRALPRVKLD